MAGLTPGEGPVLRFTGTGSSSPGKYRNLTGSSHLNVGNFLTLPDKGTIVLDAGEQTFGQLFQMLGEDVDDFIGSIKAHEIPNCQLFWISHNHADHHLGIITLLQKRYAKGWLAFNL